MLTSTYAKFENHLEIKIGFTEHTRMIIVENGSTVEVDPWVVLSEMSIELNFTMEQKMFLQELHEFYPDSAKVSVTYYCKIVNFRCFVACDIGHRIVRAREHSIAYDRELNRSVVETCTRGHDVDTLRNSSETISNRWSDLCKKVFLRRPKPGDSVFGDDAGEAEDPRAPSRTSAGFVAVIVSAVVCMIVVTIFVLHRTGNARRIRETVRRVLGYMIR